MKKIVVIDKSQQIEARLDRLLFGKSKSVVNTRIEKPFSSFKNKKRQLFIKSDANYRIRKLVSFIHRNNETYLKIRETGTLFKLGSKLTHRYILIKNIKNRRYKQLYKQRLNSYDKLFYFYQIKIPISLYCHKVFILLEIQLNTLLVKTKLVPYIFISEDLCFYRLVWVNDILVSNPHFLIGLYDTIRIPIHLYSYMHSQNHQNHYYPKIIGNFFKSYWQYMINFSQDKVWLLNNYIQSNITAEALIFDYPNLLLYSAPFKRFTKIYYRNKPNTPLDESFSTYTHLTLKITLFNYISYYK